MLLVAANQIEGLRRNVKLGQQLGVDTRFVETDEIKHIEPGLTVDGLTGGCYEPNGGYIDVTRMVLSWLGAAQAGGVRVMTPLLVSAIEASSGRVSGVVTDSGFIQAPIVVNATGTWGRELLSDLDLQVPIEKHRLDMSYIDILQQVSAISGCVTDGVSNVVMRPHWGHSMLVAAYPPAPVLIDDPVIEVSDKEYQSHHQRISRAFQERIPQLKNFSVLSNVSGAYDVTPDFHPILGWAPGIEGLCLAMGFSGHGLKLSPAIGEIISAMVLEQSSPIDVHALRYERFAQNDLMYLAYGPSARA